MNVDDVCVDADLENELEGSGSLAPLLRSGVSSALWARTNALRDVLNTLAKRTPPITEANIMVPTELRQAVVFGALERLFNAAMSDPSDVFASRRKIYEARFNAELQGLTPTVQTGARVAIFGMSVVRR